MTRRYYHPNLPDAGGNVSLSDSESQHAIRVMRVQIGDEIELFDGAGNQSAAVISEVTRRDCHCNAAAPELVDREPGVCLQLAIALPKPDRAKELIERLAELGVSEIVPIVAQRTQRPPSESLIGKLRRAVIESCKQSQRNVLMKITEPTDLTSYLESVCESAEKWIAHPDGELLSETVVESDADVAALIGPEGGWTDDEVVQSVRAGFKKVGLGKRIYRIETAAAVVAARFAM